MEMGLLMSQVMNICRTFTSLAFSPSERRSLFASWHGSTVALLLAATAALSTIVHAQVTAPNTDWTAVPYRSSAVLDVAGDQTGTTSGEMDIVGSATQPAFFIKFIPGSTTTDGTLYFRVRLGGDLSPAGFRNAVDVGIDANQDGVMDLYIGPRNSSSTARNRIYKPLTSSANNTPATVSADTTHLYKNVLQTSTIFNFSAVNAASGTAGVQMDPAADTAAHQDLNSATGTDYLISFSVPFADVVSGLSSQGITFNSTKPFTCILFTSSAGKLANRDLNGVSGGTTSTTHFASLGVLSQPMYVTGAVVNSAPVNTAPASNTINVSGAISGLSVADADGNLASVQLTATHGTVSATLTGGAVIIAGANNSSTFTLGGTIAQINAALGTIGYTATALYTGPASVTMLSKDSSDATASSTVALTVVNTTNTPPVAVNDSASTHSGKAITAAVTANDTDVDNNVLTVTLATLTSGLGTFSFSGGSITYTPTTSYVGTATLPYTISDGRGGTANATLTVTVAANHAPVVVNDSTNANTNTTVTIDALANDSDADSDSLTITNATRTSGQGTVSVVDNAIDFDSPGSFQTTTISYTVSDGYGGTATGTVTVVTGSNSAPVAVNDTAAVNSGASVLVDVLANDSDVNSDPLTISDSSITSGQGTLVPLNGKLQYTAPANFAGTATISYTIDDGRDATATGTVTITVTDATAPTISGTFSPLSLATGAGGTVALPSYTSQAVTSDNVAVTSVTQSPVAGSARSVGTTHVTLTAQDAAGNSASTSFDVTVADGTAPAISGTFSPLSLATGAGGTVALPSYTSQAVTSDNVAVTSVTQSPIAGSARSAGTTHVTLTAQDAAGNSASTSFDVTVADGTAPTIGGTFSPLTLTTGAAGTVALPSYVSQAVASDNVSVTSVTQSPAAGSARNAGTTTVTLTAYDAAGNTASTSFAVTVNDGTVPTIGGTFSPLTLTTGAGGTVALPSYTSQAVTSDNVAVTSVTQSPAAGSARSVGTTTVTLTAHDAAGNIASTSFDVAVSDGTAPTIGGTFSPLTLTTGAGGTVALPSYTSQAVTSDNVAITNVTQSPVAGSARSVGTTAVTLTAHDAAGNTSSTSFNVVVNDGTAPVLSVPSNLTLEAASAAGAVVTFAPSATDNVGTPTVVATPASGSTFALGTTTVNVAATDAAGNATSGSFTVTVRDTTAPVVHAPALGFAPLTIATETSGLASLPNYTAQANATDVVGAGAISQSPAPDTTLPVGTVPVTLTATDAAGNVGTISFNVTVIDGTAPVLAAPLGGFAPLNLATNGAGNAALPDFTTQATAADNVAVVGAITQAPAAGTLKPVGPVTVTLSAHDAAGNIGTLALMVNVNDGSLPVITTLPADRTLAAGANGTVATPDLTGEVVATDNVAVTSITQNPIAGTALGVGVTDVTISVRDGAANTVSGIVHLTVTDQSVPVIHAPAGGFTPVTLTTGANSTVALPDYAAQATATDNVAVDGEITQSPAAGTLLSVGTTAVTLSAYDDADNVGTLTFNVIVTDGKAPTLTTPANVTVEATSDAGATVTYAAATATDDVTANPAIVYSQATGTVFPVGTTTVTVTATDEAGNASTGSFTIAVQDTTAPVITDVPADITTTATSGSGTAVTFSNPTATDLVDGSVAVISSPASGSTFPIGTRTVNCTATDAHGNSSSASFTVTVQGAQTINFGSLSGKTFGDAPFAVSATGGTSGQPVTFSIVSGPATISGNVVSLTGTGFVTVRASQAGAGDYLAAANVDRSFAVAKAPQAIAFSLPVEAILTNTFALEATGGASGNPVTFTVQSGPGSISGDRLSFTAPGSVVVRASQAGDANYNAAANVEQVITVTAGADGESLVATDDRVAATPGSIVLIDVLANDSDPFGRPLVLSTVTQPPTGGVTAIVAGQVRFTAKKDFVSPVTFTYTVTAGADQATGRVTVTPPPADKYAALLSRNGVIRGRINVTLTTAGAVTGTVKRDGATFTFKGSIIGSTPIAFAKSSVPVPTSMSLSLGPLDSHGQPTLLVSVADTTPGLFLTGQAERSPYNATHPAPQAGRYTMLVELPEGVPGTEVGAALTCTIAANGTATIAGRLGDNTTVTLSDALLADGRFLFYAAVGTGATLRQMSGELVFDPAANPAVTGTLHWTVPARLVAALPAGVDQDYQTLGLPYIPSTKAATVFAPSAASATLTLGYDAPVVRPLDLNGAINRAKMQNCYFTGGIVYLVPDSGFFTGTYSPSRGVVRTFFGVILQGGSINTGCGNLIDANTVRPVTLKP
jgi:hypothetical protein